jgi:hypothetical protein
MGHSARRFVGSISTCAAFPAVFAKSENGFVPGEFCFVARRGMKHCRLAQADARTPNLVHWPIPNKKAA